MVGRILLPWRSPHQQHARPPDARHEPLLRSRPTPARFARGLPIALSCMGIVVELRALASGDGAAKPRLEMPRRTTQPAPLPRLLVAKPIDLRIAWRIPMSTPPKSVTVSNLLIFSCGSYGRQQRRVVEFWHGLLWMTRGWARVPWLPGR